MCAICVIGSPASCRLSCFPGTNGPLWDDAHHSGGQVMDSERAGESAGMTRLLAAWRCGRLLNELTYWRQRAWLYWCQNAADRGEAALAGFATALTALEPESAEMSEIRRLLGCDGPRGQLSDAALEDVEDLLELRRGWAEAVCSRSFILDELEGRTLGLLAVRNKLERLCDARELAVFQLAGTIDRLVHPNPLTDAIDWAWQPPATESPPEPAGAPTWTERRSSTNTPESSHPIPPLKWQEFGTQPLEEATFHTISAACEELNGLYGIRLIAPRFKPPKDCGTFVEGIDSRAMRVFGERVDQPHSTTAIQDEETEGKPPADPNKLTPMEQAAYASFQSAERLCNTLLKDRVAYQYLSEKGLPENFKEDFPQYILPSLSAWQKSLSNARAKMDLQKRKRRAKGKTSRSVVRPNDIDRRSRRD